MEFFSVKKIENGYKTVKNEMTDSFKQEPTEMTLQHRAVQWLTNLQCAAPLQSIHLM